MAKSVSKIEFTAELILEYSATPRVENLGKSKCSMELFTESGTVPRDGKGMIEWIIFIGTDAEDDGASIGVWWEKGRLVDYDGVFSLPTQAKTLLRKCGIVVPRDF